MTRARETQIRSVQRKMLRMVVGTKRITQDGELEEYVEWITRATDVVKQMMVDLDVPDWVEEIHRRKFRWAGRTSFAGLVVQQG